MPKTKVIIDPNDVEFWKDKISNWGTADRLYGPTCAKWSVHIFEGLLTCPNWNLHAESIGGLAEQLGVPLKFLPRAVASLTRFGIMSAHLSVPFILALYPERIAQRKNPSQQYRANVSRAESTQLKEKSDYHCAHCGKPFPAHLLVVDHLIPLSLLGADAPGNWVVMHKEHNREKSDTFNRDVIKEYQGERVHEPLGIRFIDGFFWPVINGRKRVKKRS